MTDYLVEQSNTTTERHLTDYLITESNVATERQLIN
jgi:hypothetical protein